MTELESRVLAHVHAMLVSDESCCDHDETGFSWVPYRLPQWISVEERPSDAGQPPRCLVRVYCGLVQDIEEAAPAVTLVSEVNTRATTSAIVYSREDRALYEAAAVWLAPSRFEASMQMLAEIAALQATEAHSHAPALADALGGRMAVMGCPERGRREVPDSIFGRWEEVAQLGRDQPSAYRGLPLRRMIGDGQPGWALVAFGDDDSVSGELRFSGDASAVSLAALGRSGGPQTMLLQVFTDVPHPDLGSGALMLLRLPVKFGASEAAGVANFLNEQEVRGASGVSVVGAWCVPANDETAVAFVTFLPSALATHFDLEDLAWAARGRSQWAFGALGELRESS